MTLKAIIGRRLLLGLAAASTAAAAPVPAAQTPAESREQGKLGATLPSILDRFSAQKAVVDRIVRETKKIWPVMPEEIAYFMSGSKPEQDITGAGISRPLPTRGRLAQVWSYGTPETFRGAIKHHKARIDHIMTTKSKRALKSEKIWLARMEKALPLSETYCAKVERVTAASGYEPAHSKLITARDALKAHVAAIMDNTPRKMEGVVIQAQAIQAWQAVDPFVRSLDLDAVHWPARMAESVLALEEAA